MIFADYQIFFVSLSVVNMVTRGVFAARGCPNGWVPYAESCYLGLDGSMEGNWFTAVMQCDRNNASVMVPSSDWENKFIFNSFQQHGDLFGAWINCNEAEVEGDWKCYEGDKHLTEYRKWEPDQPDGYKQRGDQDYAFMITRNYKNRPGVLGFWGDTWDYEQFFIICERPRKARCGTSTTHG